MQVIIPMSGLGERFIRAGYSIPKPLIEIENQIIISHIVNMFPNAELFIFICNKNHLDDPKIKMREKLLKICPKAKIFSIEQHKKGPIYAVLQVVNNINLDLPTIVNYCDFNCLWDFENFQKYVIDSKCDGCVVTYTGYHPHMISNTNYAYVKLKNSLVIDIQEKKPYTNKPQNENASSGTYYFKTGKLMKKYFERTIDEDLNVNGEYYVSMSYKPMIRDKLKINIYNIDYFMQWGTPEDLKDFLYYSSLFKRKINFIKNNDYIPNMVLLLPAAGLGKRFLDKGFSTPKPFIEVSNKPMILQAINDLPKAEIKKVILRKDIIDLKNSGIKNSFSNFSFQFTNNITDGQAATCLIGMDDIDKNSPLLISACDNGAIYNNNKFIDIINDTGIDIVVWGCRGFPGSLKNPNMYGWIEQENNIVKKIYVKEIYKDPQVDPIITGTFFFKKASIFKIIAKDLIYKKTTVNNEYYIDSAINNAIELGYKVYYFEIDYFLCWGTPNDLKTYKYWQDCFNNWNMHKYRKILDNDFC